MLVLWASAGSWYRFGYYQGGGSSNEWIFQKISGYSGSGGTVTTLASVTSAAIPSVGTHTIEVFVSGTTYTLYFDGTQELSATDSSYSPTKLGCEFVASTTGYHLTNFVAAPIALSTTYTVSPSGTVAGVNGQASTFAVAPNGYLTGNLVVTPAIAGLTGTFSPTPLTFTSNGTNSVAPQTFTFTPSQANTSGTLSFSHTSTDTLTNPLSITLQTAATVAVNNANVFWAPSVWYQNGSTYCECINWGAYVKIPFSGTSLSMTVDTSLNQGVSSANLPGWGLIVDGVGYSDQQITSADQSVNGSVVKTLVSGLASGNHTAWITYNLGFIAHRTEKV
jgi:hypothetical protein